MTLHLSKQLWATQHRLRDYPVGMMPVPEPIPGLAFFPGGYGLIGARSGAPLPPFPTGGVMVLGQDFHTVDCYRNSLHRGGEPMSMPTWRELLALLTQAGIDPSSVFCTNFYMGLRDSDRATGPCPGRRDSRYVNWCAHFFLQQLEAQRPRLVLVLGKEALPHLARLSPELRSFLGCTTFKSIDSSPGGPLRRNVTFDGLDEFHTNLVVLTHPSLRPANIRRRFYQGLSGHDAELQMLAEALC